MHDTAAPLTSYEIRPGTTFPDWSLISSPHAIAVLRAMLMIFDPFRERPVFSREEDAVRQALLQHYLKTGSAPDRRTITAASGLAPDVVASALADLHGRDLVLLDGETIVGAYPFLDRATEHRVVIGGQRIKTMCAIDALGAGAMAGRESRITSQCRHCSQPLRISTSNHGRAISAAEPVEPIVWIGRHYQGNCAADSLCTTMCFFCSDDHLNAWREAHLHLNGYRLSLTEGLEFGRALFEPALARQADARG